MAMTNGHRSRMTDGAQALESGDGQAGGRSATAESAPGRDFWSGNDSAAAAPATAAAPEVRVTSTRGAHGSPGVLAVPTESTQSHKAPAANQVRKRTELEPENRAPHPRTISRTAKDRDKARPPGVAPGAPTHSLARDGATNVVSPMAVRIMASRRPTWRAWFSFIGPVTPTTYPFRLVRIPRVRDRHWPPPCGLSSPDPRFGEERSAGSAFHDRVVITGY